MPSATPTAIPVTTDSMTAAEVADFLHMADGTIRRLAVKGVIPGWKVGERWRFSRAEVEKHLRGEGKK